MALNSLARKVAGLALGAAIGCGGQSETTTPAVQDAGAGGVLGGDGSVGDSQTGTLDATVEPDADLVALDKLCSKLCLAAVTLKCPWITGAGVHVCQNECLARLATCAAARDHASCVVAATSNFCTSAAVSAHGCETALEKTKACASTSDDAGQPVPKCTPGDAKDCKCEPTGFGISYCTAAGAWGECVDCKA